MDRYPKRLIEVDLPIKRISAHARREKSIRHGHISTLHIWWARRPLAACRAVICAALWPDPADDLCPTAFREAAFRIVKEFAREVMTNRPVREELLSEYTLERLIAINQENAIFGTENPNGTSVLRQILLDFIADFANWDASSNPLFLRTARALTQAAHEALGGVPGTRPLVVDPFAGGGSIPLEALRVGADAFASDLNPIAVVLNKVLLEYIPKYGQTLADEVRKWGEWTKNEAEKNLAEFYPKDSDGATPIAYLWARTIKCQGPRCGVSVPLIRTMTLSSHYHLELVKDVSSNSVQVRVNVGSKSPDRPTVANGTAVCPVCGYTTPASEVRRQLIEKSGGAREAQLLAICVDSLEHRYFRSATQQDEIPVRRCVEICMTGNHRFPSSEINPVRPFKNTRGLSAVTRIGMKRYCDLYSSRQVLAIELFLNAVERLHDQFDISQGLGLATYTALALAASRLVHQNSSLSRWQNNRSTIAGAFGKQALQITWDFAESNPIAVGPGTWNGAIEWILRVIHANIDVAGSAHSSQSPAKECPLPDNCAEAIVTDPPYFAAIPYGDLSNFFYVWLRDILYPVYPALFKTSLVDQSNEAIVTNANVGPSGLAKDASFYKKEMTLSLVKAREIVKPGGIGIVVFADSSTDSWEAILGAIIDSGWVVTGSWPLDTELQSRTQAKDAASLQSSIHIVCRPHEIPDGLRRTDDVGDWRDILNELPKRIHEWMPRLAQEGVVGADAIFACLGPALEIFSRYASVEKANGEKVELKVYLGQVWGAVAREALNMIFQGADASGFEEDARLTAMWLWTLRTADENGDVAEAEEDNESEENGKSKSVPTGYSLEYDAARKIALGLGAHLEKLGNLVEVKGETATLLSAGTRTGYLFGKDATQASTPKRKKEATQLRLALGEELKEVEEEASILPGNLLARPGATVLDQLHQSMILFGAGRGEALKQFLINEGVGHNPLFWRLAQSLSALYPPASDDKRWVDGVMARKKGLGL